MSQGTVIACRPTKDDIYAYALAKTLTKVSSPATVGLYSACRDRLSMILERIEVNMKQQVSRLERENQEKSRPRSVTPSLYGFLSLIVRLLFYRPIWTKKNQQYHNVRFIYVDFSAWHFAGSDLLWAGLAIRLLQAMQVNFGKLQLVLYRLAQHNEEEEVKKKILEDSSKDWRSKKICCCPLWFLVLSILLVPIIVMVFLLTFELPKADLEPGQGVDKTQGHVSVLEGLLIAAIGVPAASTLRFVFLTVRNLIVNLDLNIKKGMDNKRVSSQLGFMNQIRKEMWFLSCFINFMEVFERRKIRVVLKITDLDRCSPHKIVAVLNAINILLSNDESPFISILAVNPSILVQKIHFADSCFCKEERAHALLNCIVTLAFTVPPLCDDSKCSLFNSLTNNLKFSEDKITEEDKLKIVSCSHGSSRKISMDIIESNPLIDRTKAALDVKEEEEMEKLLKSILTCNKRNLHKYIFDDSMSMRRVINSIRVTVIIMKGLKKEHPQPELVAAWVVLVNQWPCRLSWIIQCVEDAQQRDDIDGKGEASLRDSKTLWKVFSESRAELYLMSEQIEDLLEQDGDPEMFEKFLKVDFQFTIKDLMIFEVATVNLDHTIRKELAQIRGTSRLKDSGWMRNLAPLPVTTIIKMDIEDVCKELERMKLPSKYIDIVRSNGLSGSALVFGDADDLKDLLDMTVGEWATFRLHFLGLPSHLQAKYKNALPKSSNCPSNQLARLPPHVAPRYWSNPSLVYS